MSIFETVMLCIALAGLMVGLIWLAGDLPRLVEKDPLDADEHEGGLPL